MATRFAELSRLLEAASQRPDRVTAAREALAEFTALYAEVRIEADADRQEAQQLGDTQRAEQIRRLLFLMDVHTGAWLQRALREWRPAR